MLEKRNLFVGKVKSRYLDTSHKFGIRLPHSVDEAIKLDKESKNTLWQGFMFVLHSNLLSVPCKILKAS